MKPASIDILFNAYQDTDEYKQLLRPEALHNVEEILFGEDISDQIEEQDINAYGALVERWGFALGFRYAFRFAAECGLFDIHETKKERI